MKNYPPFWYQCLIFLLKPLYRVKIWFKSRHPADYQSEIEQRFAVSSTVNNQHSIWFHAVSVGETHAAEPLIRHYLAKKIPILITNTTRTGQARAKSLFADAKDLVDIVFLPIDQIKLIQRFCRLYQPQILCLVETELWPNLISQCKNEHIAVSLINARLSEKSFQSYQRFMSLTQPMLLQLDIIAAQDNASADRFIKLGVDPAKIVVTGNSKIDITPANSQIQQAEELKQRWQLNNRAVVVFASTHDPEEQQILNHLNTLFAHFNQALIIIVPRHPERFDHVAKQIQQTGFCYSRRSLAQDVTAATQVYLADSMGELWCWFAMADLAFVGGSLIDIGGHNPLEPVQLNLPVLMGPSVYNFEAIANQLAAEGILFTAHSAKQLIEQVIELLQSEQTRAEVAHYAEQFIAKNRGSVPKQIELIDCSRC